MEEQPTDLAALLPGIAGQMRGLLSNLYLAAAQPFRRSAGSRTLCWIPRPPYWSRAFTVCCGW